MPAIDELPRPAQAELRARRGEEDPDHPEKRKVSLLRRLAAVGLGRRDDQEEPEKMPPPNVRQVRPAPAAGQAPRPAERPMERPMERSMERPMDRPVDRPAPPPRPAMPAPAMPRGPDPVSEYPSVRLTRVSTRSGGKRLCTTPSRKTSSTSRPSCAGRRTDHLVA